MLLSSFMTPSWWRHYLDLFGWKFASTNRKHYSKLGSGASSGWKFCARFSDVSSWGKQWWRREVSAVFSGHSNPSQNSAPQWTNKIGKMRIKPRKWNVTHRFSLHVTYQVLFSAIYYPCRRHSLIYDNTPNHNSPICVPSSFRNQCPRPRTRKTAAYGLHGLFSFNDPISWLPRY